MEQDDEFFENESSEGKNCFHRCGRLTHEELRCYQMAFEPHHRSSLQG